jgi:hypothetical protein
LAIRKRRLDFRWRAATAALLACALLVFTVIYRNSKAFSPATAARCHSLSADRADARSLFDGDFGPLAAVVDDEVLLRPLDDLIVTPPMDVPPPVVPPLDLVVSPLRRPPPTRVS